MKMLAFAASHRTNSLNRQLLEVAAACATHAGHDVSLQNFSFFDLPLFNDAWREQDGMPPHTEAIRSAFLDADALLIASPEYNWSVPAALKNMLDWISCFRPVPLQGVPVFLMCATPSERGGMSGLVHLKTTLEALGALVYPSMFGLGRAGAVLQQGAMDATKQAQLQTHVNAFLAYAEKLTASTTNAME
jgi:chromate reductase, NAD(P)H dehydrogenase (quinone)